MLLDVELTAVERYGPVVALIALSVLAGLVAWLALTRLRGRR